MGFDCNCITQTFGQCWSQCEFEGHLSGKKTRQLWLAITCRVSYRIFFVRGEERIEKPTHSSPPGKNVILETSKIVFQAYFD